MHRVNCQLLLVHAESSQPARSNKGSLHKRMAYSATVTYAKDASNNKAASCKPNDLLRFRVVGRRRFAFVGTI
jgi:hypothetical protein